MHSGFLYSALLSATALAAGGCGDSDRTFTINFAPMLGTQPFACGQTYAGVGTTQSTVKLKDFKMYVTSVELLDAAGNATPLLLEQDLRWQRDAFALLDFDNGQLGCAPGTADLNTSVRGTAPAGNYRGLRFTVGVPEEFNHLDAATAPAPLNEPGMWWSWSGGFKFIRLDVETRGNKSYFLHLGATSCDGSVGAGFTCAAGNAPVIELAEFDIDSDEITIDVGALWSGVDLDNQIDFQTDFVQGCMAFAGDPECPAVFAKLGMNINGTPTGTQAVFAKRSTK